MAPRQVRIFFSSSVFSSGGEGEEEGDGARQSAFCKCLLKGSIVRAYVIVRVTFHEIKEICFVN